MKPDTTTRAIMADSLSCFRTKSITSTIMRIVTPVDIQMFFNTQLASTYKTTEATIKAKSPLEKEKMMMKVKQTTMAGPRSPNIRNNKIDAIMAPKAIQKNDHRLCMVTYSARNLSLAAKKPARKIMMRNFTISLG